MSEWEKLSPYVAKNKFIRNFDEPFLLFSPASPWLPPIIRLLGYLGCPGFIIVFGFVSGSGVWTATRVGILFVVKKSLRYEVKTSAASVWSTSFFNTVL